MTPAKRTPTRRARAKPDSRPKRRSDVFLFSMDRREVKAAAAGVVPIRIRRACFVIDPLLRGDDAEYQRRQAAERRGTLARLMFRQAAPQ